MISQWIEHVMLRKILLNAVKLLVSWAIAHLAITNEHLSAAGITISIDAAKFSDFLNAFSFIALHEAHMWALKKWPPLADYL